MLAYRDKGGYTHKPKPPKPKKGKGRTKKKAKKDAKFVMPQTKIGRSRKSGFYASLQFLEQSGIQELGIGILKKFSKAELNLIDFIFSHYKDVLKYGISWLLQKVGCAPKTFYDMVAKEEWMELIMFKIKGTASLYAPDIFESMCKEAAINPSSTVLIKTVLSQAGLSKENPLLQVNVANLFGVENRKQIESNVKDRLKVIDMQLDQIGNRTKALPAQSEGAGSPS